MLTIKHICIIILGMNRKFYKNYLMFCLINCLSALLIGVIFYLLGRTDSLYDSGTQAKNILLNISFYLPDALWAYALFFALSLMHNCLISSLLTFLASFCWEILQKFNFVNGTFDYIDLLMYIAAIFLAVTINTLWRNKNEKNNS